MSDDPDIRVMAYQIKELSGTVKHLAEVVEAIERSRAVEAAAKQPVNNIITYVLTQGGDLLFKIGFLLIAGWLAIGGAG